MVYAVMALIFATLFAALATLHLGLRGASAAILLVCLLLSAILFLIEIHDPKDGFAMPWLQVAADVPGRAA